MSRLRPQLYAHWRAEHLALPALRETAAPLAPPSERLLQLIWLHQRLQREGLRTFDGQPLWILHPGFLNREAGPDFRAAIVQIGAAPPQVGDVEIDLVPGGWLHHEHALNPAYRNVRLHAVWAADSPPVSGLPTLVLQAALDAPLNELGRWLGSEAAPVPPTSLIGRCAAPLAALPAPTVREVVAQAAQVRLERKAAWFTARGRAVGWEQALWEELLAALGYKQNRWPMRCLGELLPRLAPPGKPLPVLALQARLLGAGGLLPAELSRARPATDRYLRELWDHWWRERDAFGDRTLPRGVWRLHNLRPANHPQRRLALAAHWRATPDWLPGLEKWLHEDLPDAALLPALRERFQTDPDAFWSRHWTLRSAITAQPQPLLGEARVTDLAVNVLLPWFWARAEAGGSQAARAAIEHRYFAWPAGQDNTVLRQARLRLFGGARPGLPGAAAMQQGLIQIVRDFCDHANALCDGCRLPSLLQTLTPPN